jgi:hypothetical protein
MGSVMTSKIIMTNRTPPDADHWSGSVVTGLAIYYLTSLVVIVGILFGREFLDLPRHAMAKRSDLLRTFANYDGQWYIKIQHRGYHYDPLHASDVAFFPAYPLTAGILVQASGCRADLALLIVSHLSLAGTFVVLAAYVRRRFPDLPATTTGFVLLALGLWPTSCFCRFAYSESMFLLMAVLAFYGMVRRWPLSVIALVIGAATATRPVGVTLLVPFLGHLWQRRVRKSACQTGVQTSEVLAGRLWTVRSVGYVALGCWGIIAYMIYLWIAFDNPLAFAQTQENWRKRPPGTALEKSVALATLEPIWSVFVPSSQAYWQRASPEPSAVFSLHLANPIYFMLAVGLTALGWRKRWLSGGEVGYAFALLAMVYVTRSYEMYMLATGRFTVTAFPIFLVLGRLLTCIPAPVAAVLLSLSAFFLGAYSALFAAWYRVF